jgi:hypothetical protein
MADATIAVNPTGATLLHTGQRTISAAANQEEYNLLADSQFATYSVPAGGVAATTANSHLLEIMAGASLNVRIKYILVTQFGALAAVNALSLQLWRLTTAGTGGTAITPTKWDNSDSPSGATAMTLPSAKGTEGTQVWQECIWLGTATIPTANNHFEFPGESRIGEYKPLIIPAGTANGIAIKNVGGIASSSVDITVVFTETTYL